jgi:hypothetical protein
LIDEDSGSELWIGFSKDENGELELHTVNPAFRGKGQMKVTFDTLVSDPAWEPFEYKISGTFSELEIPVLIEIADPRERDKLKQGQPVTLDVTAFTYNPEFYESEEAYSEAQKKSGLESQFAPNHFIPSGLFGEDPAAYSIIAGCILESELRVGADGAQEWWA